MDFVLKLAKLLEKESHIAQWNDDGTQFSITNLIEFQTNVLPQYFRHCKLSSFIRQLNMYGFRKINRRKHQIIFHHHSFIRGKDHLFHLIKRNIKSEQVNIQEEEITSRIKEKINSLRESESNFSELLNILLKFKLNIHDNFKNIKIALDKIGIQTSIKKARAVKPIIQKIRQHIRITQQSDKKINEMVYTQIKPQEKKAIIQATYCEINKKQKKTAECYLINDQPTIGQINTEKRGLKEKNSEEVSEVKSISNYIC